MNNQEIIALLRKDMQGEQQAIIQYLYHAYHMKEGTNPAAVEAISREEMRHWDWLGDVIVELGGDPTLERDPVDFARDEAHKQLMKDVGLEEAGIAQYRAHIEAIDNEPIRRLLTRILHDELVHKEQFLALAAEAEAEEAAAQGAPEAAPAEPLSERLAAILNQGVRHEYTVILQYLYHSLVAEEKELAEELHNTAVNEMQHMGWLSEGLAERGGKPEMEHTELALSRDPVENLEANIRAEQEVTRDYTAQIPEVEDPEIKELLERIRDHEVFHDAVFKDLLTEAKEEASEGEAPEPPPYVPPSVGSLKKRD
ncbi:MAG: ferritin-like domain-containing protein [Chloroflexota bacterium]